MRSRAVPNVGGSQPDRSLLSFLADIPALIMLERLPIPIMMVGVNAEICFFDGASPRCWDTIKRRSRYEESYPRLVLARPFSRRFIPAGHIVDLCHENGSTVRARMSRSALLRADDPGVLVDSLIVLDAVSSREVLMPSTPPDVSAGRAARLRVLSGSRLSNSCSSKRFMRLVRFPAAPPGRSRSGPPGLTCFLLRRRRFSGSGTPARRTTSADRAYRPVETCFLP
jgi:hypothetical protein